MRSGRSVAASVQFPTREGAERALQAVTDAGVPRDLVSFAVSEAGAIRHFEGKVEGRASVMLENAARGAWIGLVTTGLLSLGIIAWPASARPKSLGLVQLLGPNMGVMAGALIGVIWAWLAPSSTRIPGVPMPEGDQIIVSVHGLDQERANRVLGILETVGGARLPSIQAEEGA